VEKISKPKKDCIEKYKDIKSPDKEIIKKQNREDRNISGKLTKDSPELAQKLST
jgi:hypothetical protein